MMKFVTGKQTGFGIASSIKEVIPHLTQIIFEVHSQNGIGGTNFVLHSIKLEGY